MYPGNIPVWETILLYVASLWALIWKGLALWRAARQSQRNWFLVLLVVNSIGILDLVYLFRFSKKRLTLEEIKGWFKRNLFTKTKSE